MGAPLLPHRPCLIFCCIGNIKRVFQKKHIKLQNRVIFFGYVAIQRPWPTFVMLLTI
jgi:hypothetical protein